MRLLSSLVLSLNVSICLGQISIGKTDSLYSNILQENREIWVSIPKGFQGNPEQKYPVAYLLDGELYFHSFTGEVSHLSEVNGNSIIPDMIVVGIVNTNRVLNLSPTVDSASWMQPNGGGEQFTEFIEKELIPYVDKTYPTVSYRTLVGHSLGGIFVMNTFLKHTQLFNAYIALDPSFDWDGKKLISEADAILSKNSFEKNIFFLGGSSLCLETNAEFEALLNTYKSKGLKWKCQYYKEDSHGSVPLIGSYDGLRFIFDFYKRPSFKVITDESVTTLANHYENITKELGYAVSPPQDLMLGLAWRCKTLEKEFDRALQFLQLAEQYYPKSPDVLYSLAEYYNDTGDNEKAVMYMEKGKRFE